MNSIRCVVPTLNSAATLDATLLSLHAQTGVALEIVVVDSGSTDATLDICRRWQVETRYAAPGNMYRAINAGLADSRAEWLAYLNSDDHLYPNAFARLIAQAEATGAEVGYGDCDFVDQHGRFMYSFAAARPAELLPLFRFGRMSFAQPAAIFRRALYEQQAGFDESYRYKADADFYLRALRRGIRFSYLEGPPIAGFRIHAWQLSIRCAEEITEEGQRLFGGAENQTRIQDWLPLCRWCCRNLPHYLLRILRASLLARRLRLPRAFDTYSH